MSQETKVDRGTRNDLSQIKKILEELDFVDWNDPKSDPSGYRKLNLVAFLGERTGPLVREIEDLREKVKGLEDRIQVFRDIYITGNE